MEHPNTFKSLRTNSVVHLLHIQNLCEADARVLLLCLILVPSEESPVWKWYKQFYKKALCKGTRIFIYLLNNLCAINNKQKYCRLSQIT